MAAASDDLAHPIFEVDEDLGFCEQFVQSL